MNSEYTAKLDGLIINAYLNKLTHFEKIFIFL